MGGQIAALFQKAGIPCLFHLVTGAYCPGCGGTRAAKALVTGHIFQSLRYNPMVFYGAAVAAAFGLAWLYCRLRRRPALSSSSGMAMPARAASVFTAST